MERGKGNESMQAGSTTREQKRKGGKAAAQLWRATILRKKRKRGRNVQSYNVQYPTREGGKGQRITANVFWPLLRRHSGKKKKEEEKGGDGSGIANSRTVFSARP